MHHFLDLEASKDQSFAEQYMKETKLSKFNNQRFRDT